MEGVEGVGNLAGWVSHSVSISLCFLSSVVIRHRRSIKRVRFADISHHVFLLVLAVPCPDRPPFVLFFSIFD